MRSVVVYFIYVLSLLVTECILVSGCYLMENLVQYKFQFLLITDALKNGLYINILRVMYYFPFYIIAFVFLIKQLGDNNRVLNIALINCGLYIFLSFLYGFILIPDTMEYFLKPFFYYFIISTFASPFILNMIPFYKRLVKGL
jgi:hypothetical protein